MGAHAPHQRLSIPCSSRRYPSYRAPLFVALARHFSFFALSHVQCHLISICCSRCCCVPPLHHVLLDGIAAYGPFSAAKRRWPKRHFLVGPPGAAADAIIHPPSNHFEPPAQLIAFTPCLRSSHSIHPTTLLSPHLVTAKCSHRAVAKQQLRASRHKLLLLRLLLLLQLVVDLELCALALLSPSCPSPFLASFVFEVYASLE